MIIEIELVVGKFPTFSRQNLVLHPLDILLAPGLDTLTYGVNKKNGTHFM